jgi:hypothetical protein
MRNHGTGIKGISSEEARGYLINRVSSEVARHGNGIVSHDMEACQVSSREGAYYERTRLT